MKKTFSSRGLLIVIVVLAFTSCKQATRTESAITVTLNPVIPNDSIYLKWSPKGEKLILKETEEGLETALYLGPAELSPLRLIMGRTEDAEYFNYLKGDWNRNGTHEDDSILYTEPRELRGKIWSSFNGMVDISYTDSLTADVIVNPYPVAFWYVDDPTEPDAEKVIRYSRRGWMQGSFTSDSLAGSLLLAEMIMDGIYDLEDSWALAMPGADMDMYLSANARSLKDHNWLGDRAMKVIHVSPSGSSVTLELYDPGRTLEEELAARDTYAADRNAPRSGGMVAFEHDFKTAVRKASSEGKPIFIDFETSWCGPCKMMDQWVYTADQIVEQAKQVIAVKIDGDISKELVKQFAVNGYPTLILVDNNLNEIRRLVGYQTIKQVSAFLTFR